MIVENGRPDKRTLISEAAVEVFAEKGFHQARVSDISKRAGVADGTIYLYFKNKDDLLLSIFEDSMTILVNGARDELSRESCPLQKIRSFVAFHFDQVKANRSVAEVLQVELRLSNKFLKDYRPSKLWDYLGLLADVIREGQASGVIRKEVDPFMQMWALFGALDELGMQWVLARRRKIDLDVATNQVAETFVRGLKAD
jgi:TetR/AcrR family transcriptional regulator, fatty acid metabolism regulator protein